MADKPTATVYTNADGQTSFRQPDGTYVWVPEDQAQLAFDAGWAPESSADFTARTSQAEGKYDNPLLAAGLRAASVATLGLSDVIGAEVLDQREALQGFQRDNPMGSLVGDVGGIIASGGRGLVGGAGRIAQRGAGRLATKAGAAPLTQAEQILAASAKRGGVESLAPTWANKAQSMAQMAGRGAGEGAAIGLQQGVAREALAEDGDYSRALGDVGPSAVLGAGAGLIMGGVGHAAGRSDSKMIQNVLSEKKGAKLPKGYELPEKAVFDKVKAGNELAGARGRIDVAEADIAKIKASGAQTDRLEDLFAVIRDSTGAERQAAINQVKGILGYVKTTGTGRKVWNLQTERAMRMQDAAGKWKAWADKLGEDQLEGMGYGRSWADKVAGNMIGEVGWHLFGSMGGLASKVLRNLPAPVNKLLVGLLTQGVRGAGHLTRAGALMVPAAINTRSPTTDLVEDVGLRSALAPPAEVEREMVTQRRRLGDQAQALAGAGVDPLDLEEINQAIERTDAQLRHAAEVRHQQGAKALIAARLVTPTDIENAMVRKPRIRGARRPRPQDVEQLDPQAEYDGALSAYQRAGMTGDNAESMATFHKTRLELLQRPSGSAASPERQRWDKMADAVTDPAGALSRLRKGDATDQDAEMIQALFPRLYSQLRAAASLSLKADTDYQLEMKVRRTLERIAGLTPRSPSTTPQSPVRAEAEQPGLNTSRKYKPVDSQTALEGAEQRAA